MVTICLYAFLFATILHGQEMDTSITISHFMYPDIQDIQIVLDESGGNNFFLDKHYPSILNDYRINHVIIDGGLQLPQGSYFLPALLPKGTAPDSINNYSQIHYRKGDYDLGELGLALQIEGADSSFFSLQGFKQSPPVIHPYSSIYDVLQNYLVSYEHLSEDESISVDVMYHLEDYHLPLKSDITSGYKREAESFHGGLNLKKKWDNLCIELHPVFQMTHTKRQDLVASSFTLWNSVSSKLNLWGHFNLSIQQQSKMLMAEKDSELTEIATHIIHPKLQYNSGRIILEGGVALNREHFEPEGKVSWQYKHLYLAASREFHIYYEPMNMIEYMNNKYSIITMNIVYIDKPYKALLDIFKVTNSSGDQPGLRGEVEMDLSWLRLSQKAGLYNINSDNGGPVDLFNHLSLLFSPNIWPWHTARFQPFMGFESIFLKHSGIKGIDPTKIPIFDDPNLESYFSHIIHMEFGLLVNRFKVSYRLEQYNILGDVAANSSITYPLKPVQQLVVVWQFWN